MTEMQKKVVKFNFIRYNRRWNWRRYWYGINACLGLSGEVGEFNDMIKKWIFHEKEFDEEHAKKEMGDVMWYIAMMCHTFR